MLFVSLLGVSQDYSYKFTIQGVDNLAKAKEIIDPLRNLFKCYPVFNDSLDVFEFGSTINVTQSTIMNLLTQNGYVIKKFSKSIRGEEFIKEEEKEK